MAEYIEREAAIAWFMPYVHAGESIEADVVISDIKGMKAYDVEPVQEWISVGERLPEPYVPVLIHMPGEKPFQPVREGFLTGTGVWHSALFDRRPDEVTHWMPLPEPPKGE